MLGDGDNGCLLVHCFAGCSPLDILAELRHRGLLEDGWPHRDDLPQRFPKSTRPSCDHRSIQLGLQIFAESVEPRRGPVEAYLIARGLGLLPDDVCDIRFHPSCPRGSHRLPAMVALMRNAWSNEPMGVHRTFLRADGTAKADVTPAKMMLGRAAGSVVKLTPDENVSIGLGLSEGIEDGLAIIGSAWRPVWAALSSASMAQIPVLNGIECLSLFADADAPGRKAAEACAERWRTGGKAVVIVEPPRCKDFAGMVEAARHG
jgi:hypothetical protein